MKCKIIKRPSSAVVSMLRRKMPDAAARQSLEERRIESVGICQGSVLEILVASDIAEKTAGVVVGEVSGSCPQHMTCMAVLGDTGAVRAAMEAVELELGTVKKVREE